MLKRFWRYFVTLFAAGQSDAADPAMQAKMREAQGEMQQMHGQRLRERAVREITRRNAIRQMVADTQTRLQELLAEADLAESCGNQALSKRLLKLREGLAAALAATEQSLIEAEQNVVAVKEAIRREEERLRDDTAERLRLAAAWHHSQVPNVIPDPAILDQALRWTFGTLLALIVLLALALALNRLGGF